MTQPQPAALHDVVAAMEDTLDDLAVVVARQQKTITALLAALAAHHITVTLPDHQDEED